MLGADETLCFAICCFLINKALFYEVVSVISWDGNNNTTLPCISKLLYLLLLTTLLYSAESLTPANIPGKVILHPSGSRMKKHSGHSLKEKVRYV